MKGLRIVVLSDNRTVDTRLDTEHGLSIYLESPSGKYLLDTGASDLFIRNAQVLGIDLADVDYCLISHGHNDHIGGLPHFLQLNSKAKVILSSAIPGTEYISMRNFRHSITGSVDFQRYHDRFVLIDHSSRVGTVHIYANIPQNYPMPMGNRNLMTIDAAGDYVPDDFRHELAYWVDGVLFTGCAHNGILNILQDVEEPIDICIGGFHLLDGHLDQVYEDDEKLQSIASSLYSNYKNVNFYTGHCTGDHCYSTLLQFLEKKLHQFHCGDALIFG